jgi:hypothetical protein
MKGGNAVAEKKNELVPANKSELVMEEFSIVELEDRLEFAGRSNPNCTCGPKPT